VAGSQVLAQDAREEAPVGIKMVSSLARF